MGQIPRGPVARTDDAIRAEARVLAVLGDAPATLDTLARRSGLAAEIALAALVPLEWSGLARVEPGPRWRRVSR